MTGLSPCSPGWSKSSVPSPARAWPHHCSSDLGLCLQWVPGRPLLHLPFPFKPHLGPHLLPSKHDTPPTSSNFAGTAWLSEQALVHGKQLKSLELNYFLQTFRHKRCYCAAGAQPHRVHPWSCIFRQGKGHLWGTAFGFWWINFSLHPCLSFHSVHNSKPQSKWTSCTFPSRGHLRFYKALSPSMALVERRGPSGSVCWNRSQTEVSLGWCLRFLLGSSLSGNISA